MDNLSLKKTLQEIVFENNILHTVFSKIMQHIMNIEELVKYIQYLIPEPEHDHEPQPQPQHKPDACHPKNNPPLCMNTQRDYWEWITDCEEYDRIYNITNSFA
jgi:hypothetical protein